MKTERVNVTAHTFNKPAEIPGYHLATLCMLFKCRLAMSIVTEKRNIRPSHACANLVRAMTRGCGRAALFGEGQPCFRCESVPPRERFDTKHRTARRRLICPSDGPFFFKTRYHAVPASENKNSAVCFCHLSIS